jgi:hypothetical protein
LTGRLLHWFPYRDEGDPPIPRPTLDVTLRHGSTGEWTTKALVDSGAPVTIFDRGVADALTIQIGHASARYGKLDLLGVKDLPAQIEYVQICLVDQPEYWWDAEVAFITREDFQMPFQGILGSRGFLDHYMVTLDYYNNRFLVERPEDWEDRIGRTMEADPLDQWDPQWYPPA